MNAKGYGRSGGGGGGGDRAFDSAKMTALRIRYGSGLPSQKKSNLLGRSSVHLREREREF